MMVFIQQIEQVKDSIAEERHTIPDRQIFRLRFEILHLYCHFLSTAVYFKLTV
jgi:hypothetical protein